MRWRYMVKAIGMVEGTYPVCVVAWANTPEAARVTACIHADIKRRDALRWLSEPE